jgi:CMP-N-acetylneuraminic acid synthetase
MKIKTLLPLKKRSQRLPNKNILDLNGKPLFNHILETLGSIPSIDKLCIFSSSKFYEPYLVHPEIKFAHIQRSTTLDEDNCTINEVIREFIKVEDADVYVLAHATSPFLSANSIEECINSVTSGEFDSAFPASSISKFAWFRGESLNYRLGQELKATSDLEPILVEQGGLYVFTKEVFAKTNSRIGLNPFIKLIDYPESIDIDYKTDLDVANKF